MLTNSSKIDSEDSKDNKLGPIDSILYKIGVIGLIIVALAVIVYLVTGYAVIDVAYPCLFHLLTRLPCPGCGGTRALRALLKGDTFLSFYLYPPLIYGIIVYMMFMIRCFAIRHFGTTKSHDGAVVKYIYIFIALMLLQWVVKLVSQLVFGYDWLTDYTSWLL